MIEYDFSNEKEMSDEDDVAEGDQSGIFIDITQDVIMISSDDEGADKENFEPDDRPWMSMTREQRYQWESMYCLYPQRPLHIDWETSELYHEQKDREMERFVKCLLGAT